MKTICLYFEIHQNIQLKRYRFFDIGTDHYYYDDYENERLISDIAERSYMPALNALLDKGAGAAVITLGGAGSVTLGDGGEPLRMPALSSAVVDTTAAGDTFIGALAAARLEGLPLFECMAAGARASAVTVSRLGAQQSIPTRAEVEHKFGLDGLDGEAE